MKKNGFITPLALIISFILFSSLIHQIDTLDEERAFFYEENQAFLSEQLLQMATTDVLGIIKSSDNLQNDVLKYKNGNVSYNILVAEGEMIMVRLIAVTNAGRKNKVTFTYSVKQQQLREWAED